MKEIRVLGIYLSDRSGLAHQVQHVFTKYGCNIKTRLGLHEVIDDLCSPGGLILLELTGEQQELLKLENELLKLEGVQVKKMVFNT